MFWTFYDPTVEQDAEEGEMNINIFDFSPKKKSVMPTTADHLFFLLNDADVSINPVNRLT